MQALTSELQAWDANARHPERIAGAWQDRFTPRAVCRELLASLPAGLAPYGAATGEVEIAAPHAANLAS